MRTYLHHSVPRLKRIPNTPVRKELRTHDHAAFIYYGQEAFLEFIVPFIRTGLEQGDLVVHVAHRQPLPALVAALKDAGTDVDAMTASGKLLLLTAQQAFYPDGRFDADRTLSDVQGIIRAAQAKGAKQIRFSVDISYLLDGVEGMETGLEMDSRANDEIFARYPFICVCSYDASLGAPQVVEDMLDTHPLVIAGGAPVTNPYYKPWAELSKSAATLERWKRYSTRAG